MIFIKLLRKHIFLSGFSLGLYVKNVSVHGRAMSKTDFYFGCSVRSPDAAEWKPTRADYPESFCVIIKNVLPVAVIVDSPWIPGIFYYFRFLQAMRFVLVAFFETSRSVFRVFVHTIQQVCGESRPVDGRP